MRSNPLLVVVLIFRSSKPQGCPTRILMSIGPHLQFGGPNIERLTVREAQSMFGGDDSGSFRTDLVALVPSQARGAPNERIAGKRSLPSDLSRTRRDPAGFFMPSFHGHPKQ
jgi:hypothetical protein